MATKKEVRKVSADDILHVERYTDKSFDIVERILFLLKKNQMSQDDLAKRLGKNPSEISKWLRGTHNFTISTLSKIEVALKQNDIFSINSPKLYELEDFLCTAMQVESVRYMDSFILEKHKLYKSETTWESIKTDNMCLEKEYSMEMETFQ